MGEEVSISVIIPTLNEESCIEACLQRLRLAGVDELIVVDGGS
ncbi:MAG: glycosyltransferase, partial [Planctomycetota bacterium]|nr:glycosyltransferase [Planctomycetota bacterium]